jgi:hypothetical protein
MSDCKPVNNPMLVDLSLPKLEVTMLEGTKYPYCSAVGKLNYLAQVACLDIHFTTHYLSCFTQAWGEEHWKAMKHILRYLKGTLNYSIHYD